MAEKETEPAAAPEEDAAASSSETPAPEPRARAAGPSRDARPRRLRRRRKPRSGDVFLLLVVFILALAFFTLGENVVYTLYSKTAGLILIIMVVEYLVLKSTDRTRVYEMENLKLREQRRNDRALLKKSRNLLRERLEEEGEDLNEEEAARWRALANDHVEEIERRL